MNINIINNDGIIYDLQRINSKILEIYHIESEGADELKYVLYNPEKNSFDIIAPEITKYEFIRINVCYFSLNEIFFASYRGEGDKLTIDIYSYSLETNESTVIYSITDDPLLLTGEKRIKIFILSADIILVQTELLNKKQSDKFMGTIEFSQTVYDCSSGDQFVINDANFNNNGINSIIPLKNNEIMIKTGYSFLEDSRLSFESENEALIESIFITTAAKLVAEIKLEKHNIDIELLISTYYDKYILLPEVMDDYLFYNVIDLNNRTSECFFYNYFSKESITCINSEINLSDMRLAYVIGNVPYVRKNMPDRIEFYNLLTTENDVTFYDESFITVLGRLFVFEKHNGRKTVLRLYNYPQMDMVFDSKNIYIAGIIDGENYYIYV